MSEFKTTDGVTIVHQFHTSDGHIWESLVEANLWQGWLNTNQQMPAVEREPLAEEFEKLLCNYIRDYQLLKQQVLVVEKNDQ